MLGTWANLNVNSVDSAKLHAYGASIHKYPLVNKYVINTEKGSNLFRQKLYIGPVLSLNGCTAAEFDQLEALFLCAKVGESDKIEVVSVKSGRPQTYDAIKLASPIKPSLNIPLLALDLLLLATSLSLSLLLFFKVRRFLSGYLIAFTLLLTVSESKLFFLGSHIANAYDVENIRLSLLFVVGPLGIYFFPQAFHKEFWKRASFAIIVACIIVLFLSYHFLPFIYYSYVATFALLTVVIQLVLKYRKVLNTKEKKQVLTMLFCTTIGLALYFPLINFGASYGVLFGRYIVVLSIGIGVFIALMRYGLWQVETLISKSATLSLLSIIAFSAWAGLDQGLQALLNQTIGLSNKTVTAFLAAAISSLFAVPAYNFVSKSCDAFFNKDLHLLKKLLSKDILVLAEIQALDVFVEQLGTKLLNLSGAHKLHLEFIDYNRLAEPQRFDTAKDLPLEDVSNIRKEHFEFQIEHIMSVKVDLEYADRRINREIKNAIEDGIDEIARALASCCRWNYLEGGKLAS